MKRAVGGPEGTPEPTALAPAATAAAAMVAVPGTAAGAVAAGAGVGIGAAGASLVRTSVGSWGGLGLGLGVGQAGRGAVGASVSASLESLRGSLAREARAKQTNDALAASKVQQPPATRRLNEASLGAQGHTPFNVRELFIDQRTMLEM
jgi:hypothetical protein